MVWPMVAAGLGQAALGYLGNEQARKASNRAMDEVSDLRNQALQQYMQYADPSMLDQYDTAYLEGLQTVDPGTYTYSPEAYEYLAAPSLEEYSPWEDVQAQEIADSPEARAIQYGALQDLQQRAEEGLTAQDQADYMRGRQRAGEMARGREGAIQRSLEARGMGGSGIEAAMRQIASQQSVGQLSDMEAQRAAENARQRALATQMAMAGGERLRGQDIALNQANANILNQFAWDNSAMKAKIKNMNTELTNKQIMDAINEQRRIAGLNTGEANIAQQINQDRDIRRNITRQQSANQNLLAGGEGKNRALMDKYGAQSQYGANIAGMTTGGIPDIYAKGAGEAAYKRGLFDIGSKALGTASDIYQNERYLDRKYPKQQPKPIA